MPELAVYHRVRIGAKLRSRTRPVALDCLYQANVGHLQQILASLARGNCVPADQVVQDSGVKGGQALESPPVARLLVRLDQMLNLAVIDFRRCVWTGKHTPPM